MFHYSQIMHEKMSKSVNLGEPRGLGEAARELQTLARSDDVYPFALVEEVQITVENSGDFDRTRTASMNLIAGASISANLVRVFFMFLYSITAFRRVSSSSSTDGILTRCILSVTRHF